MEEKGKSFEDIMKELESALKEDYLFEEGQVLGSMCTRPLEGSVDAHAMFIESNLGNPGLYPGTKMLEGEIVSMVSDLLHGKNLSGQILSGGTEGNITAAWVARNVTGRKEVLFCENAHFSMDKACDVLRMKPVEVGLNENYEMDVEEAREKISDNTAIVVASAGSTELGVIDPIKELSELCGGEVFLHVDASFGGFVIPFLKDLGYPTKPFDFELDGVSSLVLDGHKMGLATVPSSVFLLRKEEDLRSIAVESPYLTSVYQTSLLGTRCSASVASLYFTMKALGRKGYRETVKECMDNTKYLVSEVKRIGLDVAIEPVMNICGIMVEDSVGVRKELEDRDWKISLSGYPPCLRVVVMPHVKKQVIDSLISDLEDVCRRKGEI
jgi:tyrosine decarboxylase/aspartate 1-decarboxylase